MSYLSLSSLIASLAVLAVALTMLHLLAVWSDHNRPLGFTSEPREPFVFDATKYDTDCKNIILPFMPRGKGSTVYRTGFFRFFQTSKAGDIETADGKSDSVHGHSIDILDARRIPSVEFNFHTTGFELFKMPSPPATKDWLNSTHVALFTDVIENEVRRLYPQTKRVMWTNGQIRGGHTLHRPVYSPHLYSQDLSALHEFNSRHPAQTNDSLLLVGAFDTTGEELRKLIGVWCVHIR